MLNNTKYISFISGPLMYIFNLSFKNSVFLDSMKLKWIISIYIKGNKDDVSKYRPISLLTQLSKILGSVHFRVMIFLVINKKHIS